MRNYSPADIGYLKMALKSAKKGLGSTFPNPMVGCVIVKNGRIIGQGHHHKAGLPHAEIEALNNAKTDVKGATLYVNLEPCSHYGKTPPCADAIIKAKIARVVCCALDPNPKVSGNGVKKLRAAGIKVSLGALEREAEILNETFFKFQRTGCPFVAIKFAASLDGKIATRSFDSRWITNRQARNFARNLRSQYQSILVGVNTIIRDNPSLGANLSGKPDPLRIILDSKLRIPLKSRVLRDNNVLIVTTNRASQKKYAELGRRGIPIFKYAGKTISIPKVLKELARREITSVFVEGGGQTLGSFVDARLIDKVYAFHAPLLIGGQNATGAVAGQGAAEILNALRLNKIKRKNFGDNTLIIGYVSRCTDRDKPD